MEIFVTRKIPAAGLERLAATGTLKVSEADGQLGPEELVEAAAGAEVLVSILSDPLDKGVLSRLEGLRLVAQYAVGYNNIDLDYARERAIAVTNTPGVLTDATADLTLALILAVTRRLCESERLLRRGGFQGWAPEFQLGVSLQGAVLGIYGLGRIGQAVARRARCFGMEVIYSSRSRRKGFEQEVGARFVTFEEMLAQADVVSIHAPLNLETYHRFDRTAFKLMKRGAYLINTARGPIVKEMDLADALEQGLLAGAGLDVYEAEPVVEPRLLAMEQVVLLPHIGSATRTVRDRMALMVADNVEAFAEGRQLPNRVV